MEDAEFRTLFKKLIERCSLPPQQADTVLHRILTTLEAQGTIQKKEGEPPWKKP